MKRITITHGYFALVDDEDFERINSHTWSLSKKKDGIGMYASTRVLGKKTKMHHLILPKKANFLLDHKDKDSLNNQKSNLRYVSNSENGINRKIQRNNTAGYTGVTFNKRLQKWIAQIGVNMKKLHIGCYSTKKAAIEARISAEEKFFPEVIKDRSRRVKARKLQQVNRYKYRHKISSSGYKCVYIRQSGNFSVIFHKDRKWKCLGTYHTAKKAAEVYIKYFKSVFGYEPYKL